MTKILAVKLRAIGDTVIWTSALKALRQEFPTAEIHVLTFATNEAVLRHHPAIDQAHFIPAGSTWQLIQALWKLRRAQNWDWFLGFHATTSLCRWAWLAGAKAQVLHHHSWTCTPRGSKPIAEPGKLEDAIARDYQVLRAMGVNPKRQPTSIVLTEEERASARAQMPERGLPLMAFLPGAGHHLRRYPKDLLLPYMRKIQEQGQYEPVIIVDQALSREWNLREAGFRLFDQGNLRQFIAQVSCAKKALANDSGPGHIAVALGLPTDFVFGPGCAGDWHPYDRQINPLHRAQVDCRAQGPRDQEAFQFCTVQECAHHRCMRTIESLT